MSNGFFFLSEINRNWSCDCGIKVIFQGWVWEGRLKVRTAAVAPERQNQSFQVCSTFNLDCAILLSHSVACKCRSLGVSQPRMLS